MTAKVGRAAAISTPPRPRRRRHFHIKMADESAEEASRESTQCDPDKAGEGEWLDVLGSGQLRKKVLREGLGDHTRPVSSSRVTVRVKGKLQDGSVVEENESLSFFVGEGEVIQALDLVVSLMAEGELCLVKAAARFAYGDLGHDPLIPPGADMTYEVELLSVEAPLDVVKVTETELVEVVRRKKERGNWYFGRAEYEKAVNCFQRGGELLEQYVIEAEATQEVHYWTALCWNNLAAALLKLDLLKDAREALQKVLKLDKTNATALFRMGKVYSGQGDHKKAVQYFKMAAAEEPNEKYIQKMLQRAQQRVAEESRREKAMYRRMIQGLGRDEGEGEGEGEGQATSSTSARLGPWPYLVTASIVAALAVGVAYFIVTRH